MLDAAYRHFNRALALNPRDAAAYEGLARVWRDWGLPQLALGDAHRATFFAPQSASARNTSARSCRRSDATRMRKPPTSWRSWLDPRRRLRRQQSLLSRVPRRPDRRRDRHMQRGAAARPDRSPRRATTWRSRSPRPGASTWRARSFSTPATAPAALQHAASSISQPGETASALAAFDAASKARPTFNISRERAAQIRGAARLDGRRRHATAAPGQ